MAAAACRFAAVMGLLLSPGCSRPTPPASDATAWITYACDDGRVLLAAYVDSRTARIRLAGASHTLKQVVSGSGARFTGDGLQWWIKGDTGMLATLAPGEEIAAAPGVRCAPQADATVSSPGPGTPGGLPDDRTPLNGSGAAADRAGGGQAAATVVETYYALLESGRTGEASRLRIDGLAESLKPYLTLSAQVGAPGPVEGAAGALYVEVPVVTYGRMADGTTFHRSGKATLRRVNDVPGSTAVQRTWRIDRIEPD